MPELPEVEVVRRGLAEHFVGRLVGGVAVLHARTARRQEAGATQFEALLTGRTFTGARRRGKFLWLATDDADLVMTAHLGMSGQFRIDGDAADHRHARARFDLVPTAGLRPTTGWFLDQRTFGWLAVTGLVADPTGELVPTPVMGIARDPFDPAFDVATTARLIRRRRVEVKRLLLDQSVVAGIGNIYADEALWLAGVYPRRRTDRLSARTVREILGCATEVMSQALAAGGTSFDALYVDVNGASGYFSRGLAVYGRAGQPCPRCGVPIVREAFGNRSSHFCPGCQRPPRRAD